MYICICIYGNQYVYHNQLEHNSIVLIFLWNVIKLRSKIILVFEKSSLAVILH